MSFLKPELSLFMMAIIHLNRYNRALTPWQFSLQAVPCNAFSAVYYENASLPYIRTIIYGMEQYMARLQDLYNRIPRRHAAENVQEINSILDDYADILGSIESLNAWYEKNTAVFYPSLETIKNTIKMSNSNKHAKKAKDALFDEASGNLKDDIQSLMAVYDAGNKTGDDVK